MGINTVEREGVSFSHPARFVLVGTMNPEEGDLRPQLLDRFGLVVQVTGERDVALRKEIVKRRLEYEQNTAAMVKRYAKEEQEMRERISRAKQALVEVSVPEEIYDIAARIGIALEVDGHRADITMLKTARTIAAYMGENTVTQDHICKAAMLVLPHRMRKHPFENTMLDSQRISELVYA